MLDSSSSDMQQNGSFVPKRRRVDDDVYVLSDGFDDELMIEIEEVFFENPFNFDMQPEPQYSNQGSHKNFLSSSSNSAVAMVSSSGPSVSLNRSAQLPNTSGPRNIFADPFAGNSTMVAAVIDISDARPSVLSKRRFTHLVGKGRAALSITCSLPTIVLTSDIRQRYMSMWGNVFNEYDLPMMVSFLNQRTRGDVVMNVSFPQGRAAVMPPEMPVSSASSSSSPSVDHQMDSSSNCGVMLQTTTKQQLLLHWAAVMLMSPDQVVRYDCIRIKPRTDGREGSVIRCRQGVRGTLPFQATELDIIQELQRDIQQKASNITNGNGSVSNAANDVEAFVKLLSTCSCPPLPLAANPSHLLIGGTTSFTLDADKRIERIDLFLKPDPSTGYYDDSTR